MTPCPKCGSTDLSVVAGTWRCNDCHNYFAPAPAPVTTSDPTVNLVMIYELPEIRASRERLRKQADSHIRSSIICNVIGVILLFLGIFASASWALGVAAGFITCGIVSYIVGQLVHIRANTEK